MLADAPQIVTDRPCYSAVAPLQLRGSGFTPGGALTVTGTWITGRVAGNSDPCSR